MYCEPAAPNAVLMAVKSSYSHLLHGELELEELKREVSLLKLYLSFSLSPWVASWFLGSLL